MFYAEPILFFFMAAVMIEYTFVQDLVYLKLCINKLGLKDFDNIEKLCNSKSSSKVAGNEYLNIILVYNLILTLFQLFTTTVIGSWNDIFGKKLTLLIPPIFSFIVQLILVYSSLNVFSQNIIIFVLICSFISGLSGSLSAVITCCHSYLTNKINKNSVTKRLTILEACLFTGSLFGFSAAKEIIAYTKPENKHFVAFLILAFIHLTLVIYVKFFLKENQENNLNLKDLIKVDHFVNSFKTVLKQRENNGRIKLLVLNFSCFASTCALSVQQILLFLYLKEMSWSVEQYTNLQSLNSLTNVFSLLLICPLIQIILNKIFNNEFSISRRNLNENDTGYDEKDYKIDSIIAILGFLSKFLGLIILGIVNNDKLIYLLPLFFSLNEFAMPGIRSMVSKLVEKDEKGKAFAILAFNRNLSSLLSMLLAKSIYNRTKDFYPGFTFIVVSIIQFITIVFLSLMLFKKK